MRNTVCKLYIVLFFLMSTVGFAQQSKTTVMHLGKPHYIHLVQKGETLYGLSKTYEVSIDEILSLNPIIKEKGLSLGTELIVPAKGITSITHTVLKGETLYAISKKYSCTIEDILQINPEVKEHGLKLDQIIQIPSQSMPAQTTIPNKAQPEVEAPIQEISKPIEIDQEVDVEDEKPLVLVNTTDSVHIALLLPFYLTENDSAMVKKSKIFQKSELSLDIYAGVLHAIDSLEELGTPFTLRVFDVSADTVALKKWIASTNLSIFDLIIGPLYQNAFQIMAKEANKYKIPVFCPVPNSPKILENAPNAYKMFPSLMAQYTKAGDCIAKSYSKEKLILIDHGGKNREFAKQLVSKFNLLHSTDEKFIRDSAVYLSMSRVDLARINTQLSGSKKNIILVLSEDVVFVSDLVNKLYNSSKNDQIYLFGPEIWMNFSNLDIDQLQALHAHVVTSTYVGNHLQDSLFSIEVQNKYGCYPSKYFLAGYNAVFYFTQNIHSNNPFPVEEWRGMRLHFTRPDEKNGNDNSASYILKMQDYSFVKIY